MLPAHGGIRRENMNVRLITKAQSEKLMRNGKKQRQTRDTGETIDFKPVVKLFTPDAQCTWLLSELYID